VIFGAILVKKTGFLNWVKFAMTKQSKMSLKPRARVMNNEKCKCSRSHDTSFSIPMPFSLLLGAVSDKFYNRTFLTSILV